MLWHEHGWKVIWERMLSVGLWDPSGMCGEACCSAGLLIEICGISENRLSCHCWHHCSHASHPLKTEREGEEERRGETDVAYWGSVFVPPYPSCTQCSIRVFWLRTSQNAARPCHPSIFRIHNTIADLDLFWVLLWQTTLAYNRKLLFSVRIGAFSYPQSKFSTVYTVADFVCIIFFRTAINFQCASKASFPTKTDLTFIYNLNTNL